MKRPIMRSGFTMVELLVVTGILMLIFAMSASVFAVNRNATGAEVRSSAERLAATLRKARSLAMATGSCHGVAFHMQGSAASDGKVPDNWTGGHWYRIIGPTPPSGENGLTGVTIPTPFGGDTGNSMIRMPTRNFPDFIELVKRCWVGDAVSLPAYKVRFLALSDLDMGNRLAYTNHPEGATAPTGRSVASRIFADSYPRPWFGVLRGSGTSWTWYPWGGMDSAKGGLAAGLYMNADSALTASTQTVATSVARTFATDLNGDGDVADVFTSGTTAVPPLDRNGDGVADSPSKETGDAIAGLATTSPYVLEAAGSARALVNAHWLDAVIVFFPDGTAMAPEWFWSRHFYGNDSMPTTGWSTSSQSYTGFAGIRQRSVLGSAGTDEAAKSAIGTATVRPLDDIKSEVSAEAVHLDAVTGGYHITLGPDAVEGVGGMPNSTFTSPEACLRAITPAVRVFVSRSGTVEVVPVSQVMPSRFTTTGSSLWPTTSPLPTPPLSTHWFWNTQASVGQWARYGYKTLSITDAATAYHNRYPRDPKAWPITSAVTRNMLIYQQWWAIDP